MKSDGQTIPSPPNGHVAAAADQVDTGGMQRVRGRSLCLSALKLREPQIILTNPPDTSLALADLASPWTIARGSHAAQDW